MKVGVIQRVMKRITMWLSIAIITFVVGIIAASVWVIRRHPSPPLTVCELISNRENNISKSVRVRGVLLGYDEKGLYAPDCEGGRSYVHANFDDASEKALFERVANLKGAGMHGYDIWVRATFSGRFEKLQNVGCENGKQTGLPKFGYDICCYELKVSDVEDVEPVSPSVPFPY